MDAKQVVATAVLADRFLKCNPQVSVSPALKAGLVAVVASVMMSLAPADAKAQSFADTQVGSSLGTVGSGISQIGSGLLGAAKAMVVGSGVRDVGNGLSEGATKATSAIMTGTANAAQTAGRAMGAEGFSEVAPHFTPQEIEEAVGAEAKNATTMKAGRMQFGSAEWRVQTKATKKDGLTQVVNRQGDSMWLNAAGKATDPRPGVPAIQHADGGFEHFQNGKLTPVAGSSLVARLGGEGIEYHLDKNGEMYQKAPVVEATIKRVGPSLAMR